MQINKDFICHTSFKEHEVMYSIHKHFSCKKCSKAFDCSMILKEHYVIHCAYKTFACKYCSNDLISFMSLKEHEVIYSRLKKFSGQQYRKKIGWSRNIRHELLHSIDNPFHLRSVPLSSGPTLGSSLLA